MTYERSQRTGVVVPRSGMGETKTTEAHGRLLVEV